MLRRFGFGKSWCSELGPVFFCGNLYVLVNDIPTEEVNMQRVLKQGDLLALFLCLLVVEGLINAAVRSGG